MKRKILAVVSAIFGLLLVNSGLNKFWFYMPVPEGLPEALIQDNTALMEIEWLMPLIGVAEVLGGILLLFPKTRPLGWLVVFPVMVGMLLTHLTTARFGLPMALVIWGVMLWILWEERRKFLRLITSNPRYR